MEKPDMSRRGLLKGLVGVAAGSVIGNEVAAREPDISREFGPMGQFGTYYDFVARFNSEMNLSIRPIGLESGDTIVLHLKNVNGNDVRLPILSRPATEADIVAQASYTVFREMLLDYTRREL